MGLINWLLGKPAARPTTSSQTDIHANLADATRPFTAGKASAYPPNLATAGSSTQRLEQRRSERNARRELLFQVVRESMVRVGVLSSAFKFKVLALDQRGRTFLVMIDLSAEFANETAKLAEIEALIAHTAKIRFELIVQAVYWRFYEAVSTGVARMGAASAPAPLFGMPTNSRPAPLSAQPYPNPSAPAPSPAPVARPVVRPAAVPAPMSSAASAAAASSAAARPAIKPGAEPIEQDEMEAFRRALAGGTQPGMPIALTDKDAAYAKTVPIARPRTASPVAPVAAAPTAAALAAAAKAASLAAINNKLLLTGYEDTEMHDPNEPAPALSTTQYGELR
jgi:hypothetical protein